MSRVDGSSGSEKAPLTRAGEPADLPPDGTSAADLFGAVIRSKVLRAAVVFGLSGLGFVAANLLLARALRPEEYGLFTLVIGLLNFGLMIAPLGADGVVNRRRLDPGPELLRRVLGTSLVVALGLTALGSLLYALRTELLLLLCLGILAGGSNRLASAHFQSRRRFRLSLALSESANVVLVLAALGAILYGLERGTLPVTIVVLGYVASAAVGLAMMLGDRRACPRPFEAYSWGDGLSYAVMAGGGLLLVQLERLVVPKVLTLEDLAAFGVLAAIVIAPFRMLQMGAGYTLLPRLRAAASVAGRRRLLRNEALIAGATALGATVAVWYLAPAVVGWLLEGKYTLGPALVAAGVVAGMLRVLNGFLKGAVTALTTTRQLGYMSALGWVSVGVALAGGVVGSRWGLVGLVLGMSTGWLFRAAASALIVLPHLRTPADGCLAQPRAAMAPETSGTPPEPRAPGARIPSAPEAHPGRR